MDSSRRNKRTNCSPKIRIPDNRTTEHTICDNVNESQCDDCMNIPFQNNPSGISINSINANNLNTVVLPSNSKKKRINYKIQRYAKIISEIPEKIAKEKGKDHLFFTSANAQIFEAKVVYFPGKNLNDIRQALTSKKVTESLNDILRTQNNFIRKHPLSTKEKTFGKHLTSSKKKKKRRMKIAPKPLNTIQEVYENVKSNETSKTNVERVEDIKGACNSIQMYTTDVSENTCSNQGPSKMSDVNDVNAEAYKSAKPYGHNECICYSFQEDKNVFEMKNERNPKDKNDNTLLVKNEEETMKRVFELRDIYEKLSKNNTVHLENKDSNISEQNVPLTSIPFEHTVSCKECRVILRNLIGTNEVSEEDFAISEMPQKFAKRIVDPLIQETCQSENDQNKKFEMNNTIALSRMVIRKHRRFKKKGYEHNEQYKNLLLLALAISIVLYCFYCRLNEKKK